MPDPDIQPSEQQLWGLTPGVPPALVPAQVQAQVQPQVQPQQAPVITPAPSPPPPPSAIDTGVPPQTPESSRWGTEPSPDAVGKIDDNFEFNSNRQEEIKNFRNRTLSVIDHSELPPAFRREQHPEYGRLSEAEQLLSRMTNRKEISMYKPQVDAMRKRIDHEVDARDRAARTTRREQLAREDAPYMSPDAKQKVASIMDQTLQTEITDDVAKLQSKKPEVARQADYDLAVGPWTTMSKPKPGADPDEKPSATNRDYRPLRDAAASLNLHNRNLVSNEASVRYLVKLATPGGGSDEKGNQLKGYNGRYGAGATNYKVIGRDDLDNVFVEMNDGMRLRVPKQVFNQAEQARLQGVQRAKQWELNYKKSQEPGWISRTLKSIIPEKGF